MSSSRGIFSEDVVSRLTCTLELYLDGMIRHLAPAQPSALHRHSSVSSLGQLDALPAELLFMVLNHLDFLSLSRISRTSLQGKAVIEALPTYQQVMEHAPTLLTALGKTGLLGFHSAMLIDQVLRSDQCVSCLDFGAFVFLPTCERICYECLCENKAYWMIRHNIAKQCFDLTDEQLETIPVMYSIPGTYWVGPLQWRRDRVLRLVSVKQAKQLSIHLHGLYVGGAGSGRIPQESLMFQDFHDAPLEPPGCDLSRLPPKGGFGEDGFGGMASMRVPFLSGAGPDLGRLCLGCDFTYWLYQAGILPAHVLSDLVPRGVNAHRPLLANLSRLRSREGFMKHIETCYGVQWLLAEWSKVSS